MSTFALTDPFTFPLSPAPFEARTDFSARKIVPYDSGAFSTPEIKRVNTENAQASTEKQIPSRLLARRLRGLFHDSKHDVFEDGVESDFSREIVSLVIRRPDEVLSELALRLEADDVPKASLAEALRWIGRLDDKPSHNRRRWLLEYALGHPAPIIRDGAIVGLAAMDDQLSSKSLTRALELETIPELMQDLTQLLHQLEYPEQWYGLCTETDSTR